MIGSALDWAQAERHIAIERDREAICARAARLVFDDDVSPALRRAALFAIDETYEIAAERHLAELSQWFVPLWAQDFPN